MSAHPSLGKTCETDAAAPRDATPPPCTIIVPVYNSFAEALACLQSVLRSTHGDVRLLVVDDASAEGCFRDVLPAEMLQRPRLEVRRNAQNLGFVKTCNWAMREAGDDDVVLLNSDTEVTPGWLDRLRAAAYSDPRVGTVTPLTNNGEIASVPRFLVGNRLPAGFHLDEFAALVESLSQRQYVRAPTCVGFCVYIKRELLARVGLFDEKRFGRGYGEENDLSCRGQAAGYVDIIDDATYVFHKGHCSFQGEKAVLSVRNLAILEQKHPGYKNRVQQFALTNPLRTTHSRIAEALYRRWLERSEFSVLHVLHKQPFTEESPERLPGGIEYHVADLIRSAPDAAHWSLWADPEAYCLQGHAPDIDVAYRFDKARFDAAALIDARLFDVVHLHHASAFSAPALVQALRRHGRYCVSLHDFALCCPRTNLVDAAGQLCGLDGCQAACGRAADETPRLRAVAAKLFAGAQAVVHFSQSTREYYQRCIRAKPRWRLIPHALPAQIGRAPLPEPPRPGPSAPLKVVFLGGISRIKGSELVQELAAVDALADGTPIEWHLAGLFDGQLHPNVRHHGRYRRADLPDLLRSIGPHLAAVLSICPETYCLTLDEAFSCGLPALVTPRGAPPERVLQHELGWVLPRLDAAAVLQALASIVADWQQYRTVRRRAAAAPLGDPTAVAREYQALYRQVAPSARGAQFEEITARLEELQRGFPCRVPRSRQIAGGMLNRGIRLLDQTGVRPVAARVAAKILPTRVRQLLFRLRKEAAEGGS